MSTAWYVYAPIASLRPENTGMQRPNTSLPHEDKENVEDILGRSKVNYCLVPWWMVRSQWHNRNGCNGCNNDYAKHSSSENQQQCQHQPEQRRICQQQCKSASNNAALIIPQHIIYQEQCSICQQPLCHQRSSTMQDRQSTIIDNAGSTINDHQRRIDHQRSSTTQDRPSAIINNAGSTINDHQQLSIVHQRSSTTQDRPSTIINNAGSTINDHQQRRIDHQRSSTTQDRPSTIIINAGSTINDQQCSIYHQ